MSLSHLGPCHSRHYHRPGACFPPPDKVRLVYRSTPLTGVCDHEQSPPMRPGSAASRAGCGAPEHSIGHLVSGPVPQFPGPLPAGRAWISLGEGWRPPAQAAGGLLQVRAGGEEIGDVLGLRGQRWAYGLFVPQAVHEVTPRVRLDLSPDVAAGSLQPLRTAPGMLGVRR